MEESGGREAGPSAKIIKALGRYCTYQGSERVRLKAKEKRRWQSRTSEIKEAGKVKFTDVEPHTSFTPHPRLEAKIRRGNLFDTAIGSDYCMYT